MADTLTSLTIELETVQTAMRNPEEEVRMQSRSSRSRSFTDLQRQEADLLRRIAALGDSPMIRQVVVTQTEEF